MTFSRSGDAGALALTAETKSLTRDFVETYGGRVHLAQFRPGESTTAFIQKIKAA